MLITITCVVVDVTCLAMIGLVGRIADALESINDNDELLVPPVNRWVAENESKKG